MTPRLSVAGLSYEFDGRRALDEVSFELAAGEVLSLVGPNGSGKSTLLKTLAGILPQRSGQVRYQGQEISRESLAWRARRISYVGADLIAQFPMTAWEAVQLGRSSQGGRFLHLSSDDDSIAVEQAMRRCNCGDLASRDLHTLSGGERQLVALARALVQGARVLLLDESLSRMDLHHQAAVGRLLTELASQDGYSVVLVSHDINIASEWARTALLLSRGRRLAYGPIADVLKLEHLREMYPGAELVVAPSPVSGAPKVFFGRRS